MEILNKAQSLNHMRWKRPLDHYSYLFYSNEKDFSKSYKFPVFNTFWKTRNCYAEDVFKACLEGVFKTSWKATNVGQQPFSKSCFSKWKWVLLVVAIPLGKLLPLLKLISFSWSLYFYWRLSFLVEAICFSGSHSSLWTSFNLKRKSFFFIIRHVI